MSIDEKWKEANKLLLIVRDDLEQLETGKDTSVFLQGRLATNINNLSRLSEGLNGLVGQQSGPKKDIWRIRVKQLTEECKTSRQAVDTYMRTKYAKDKEEEERTQLMERRSKGGASTYMQQLHAEGDSLQRSHTAVDDIENAGRGILSSLYTQNESIKKTQRRLWDIANTLGLSRHLIRRIQRRNSVDKLMVYAGMVITLLIIGLLWYYVRQ